MDLAIVHDFSAFLFVFGDDVQMIRRFVNLGDAHHMANGLGFGPAVYSVSLLW